MTHVAQVMSTTVVTIAVGTGVVQAAQVMVGRDKGALPIVDGERVVGIVTDRDILAEAVAKGRDVNTLTVDDVATHGVVTIDPEASLEEARQEMTHRRLDRLIVTNNGRILGVVSRADIGFPESTGDDATDLAGAR